MEGRVSDLREIQGEAVFEWELKDFFRLSDKNEKRFKSPKFYFSGSSWELSIYPNGESKKTNGWISLFLTRTSTGFVVTVDYTLGIKTVDGKTYIQRKSKKVFDEKNAGFGYDQLISRKDFLEKKSQFTATNVIIVVCALKSDEQKSTKGSLFNRLQDVSDNLKEIFTKRRRTDVILKAEGGNIRAHRMILERRSPVFAAMFNRVKMICGTDEVCVDDFDKSTMEFLLEYMYSGDNKEFTTGNVLPVYAAAKKYDIKEMREMCSEFVLKNLSVEWVCEVIEIAELNQLKEIIPHVREYFVQNADKILDTENWMTFKRYNHDLAIELLSSKVKVLHSD